MGTAADWLLRFLVHPQPDLHLARQGAGACRICGVDVTVALAELTAELDLAGGAPEPVFTEFTGPGSW